MISIYNLIYIVDKACKKMTAQTCRAAIQLILFYIITDNVIFKKCISKMQQFQSNYYTASQMLYIVAVTQLCLTITVASTWNYTVSTKNWTLSISSLKKLVRDITRISCFVITMKLPHALLIYSSVFVKSFPVAKIWATLVVPSIMVELNNKHEVHLNILLTDMTMGETVHSRARARKEQSILLLCL